MSAGWTKEQVARWPRVIGRLEGTYTPPSLEAMTAEVSTALAPQLDAIEREVTPSEVERKQRRGIVKHLTLSLIHI